ncbi:MAG: galactokinase [Acidothermales bacterium]|nr:galactokinase [Acidothermales bacterium]
MSAVVDGPAAAAFARLTGHPPEGVWSAPGRVNLIGEHTDYNEGWALPFAVDRWVTAAVGRRYDGWLRIASLHRPGTFAAALADVRPGAVSDWAAYAAGPVWALLDAGVRITGLDVVLGSDLPAESGLASSAAVECAVLLAARDLFGGPDDPAVLAALAQRAETEMAGVPCGIMDQMASMTCVAGHALLLDARSGTVEQLPFDSDAAGLALLVVDTRTERALAGGAYAARRRSCAEAARALGVPALRDVSEAEVEAARTRLGEPGYRRVRHVSSENQRVLKVADHLRSGHPERVGAALTASHVSLRDDYDVSTPALDTAVDAALAAGALGARMTGAGFGGCAIALVPAAAVEPVGDAVRRAAAAEELPEPDVFAVRPSDGARRVA